MYILYQLLYLLHMVCNDLNYKSNFVQLLSNHTIAWRTYNYLAYTSMFYYSCPVWRSTTEILIHIHTFFYAISTYFTVTLIYHVTLSYPPTEQPQTIKHLIDWITMLSSLQKGHVLRLK